jgi:hypothetical protein
MLAKCHLRRKNVNLAALVFTNPRIDQRWATCVVQNDTQIGKELLNLETQFSLRLKMKYDSQRATILNHAF